MERLDYFTWTLVYLPGLVMAVVGYCLGQWLVFCGGLGWMLSWTGTLWTEMKKERDAAKERQEKRQEEEMARERFSTNLVLEQWILERQKSITIQIEE